MSLGRKEWCLGNYRGGQEKGGKTDPKNIGEKPSTCSCTWGQEKAGAALQKTYIVKFAGSGTVKKKKKELSGSTHQRRHARECGIESPQEKVEIHTN